MSKLRILLAVLVNVAALALIARAVVAPWRANVVKREVTVATASALALQDEATARSIADANLQALAALEQVLPRDAVVQVLVAANCRVQRRYPEAIAAYEKALAWEPTGYVWLNRGVTELAANRPDEARSSFARAVAFDPSLRDATEEAMRAWESSAGSAALPN